MYGVKFFKAPFGIASHGTELYVSDWYNGTIERYDLLDNTLVPMTSFQLGQPAAIVYCQRTSSVNGRCKISIVVGEMLCILEIFLSIRNIGVNPNVKT